MNEASPPALVSAASADHALANCKIGVLLVNLGTPEAADAASVRRYLKEFLSDPRVIEEDRKSTRLNSSHVAISYAVFCSKKNTAASKQSSHSLSVSFMAM